MNEGESVFQSKKHYPDRRTIIIIVIVCCITCCSLIGARQYTSKLAHTDNGLVASGDSRKVSMEKDNTVQAGVNRYVEFMNAILLTSRYNEIISQKFGSQLIIDKDNEYTKALKAYLAPYREEPIYPLIEMMSQSGFNFARPVELMLCFGDSDDFTLQYQPSEYLVKCCGGMEHIHTLINMLKAFEEKTDFFIFWDSIKDYYDPIISKVSNTTYPYIQLMEEEYGVKQDSYQMLLSSLLEGNYGIKLKNLRTGEMDVFTVFATNDYSLSSKILFHENSHPFINPLTEKYHDLVQTHEAAYEKLKKYKKPDFQSGYMGFEECINEHLVRAMSIHLLQKIGDQKQAAEALKMDISLGYMYLPEILKKYDYYDVNRDKYPTFESFYPELLKVFDEDIDQTVN